MDLVRSLKFKLSSSTHADQKDKERRDEYFSFSKVSWWIAIKLEVLKMLNLSYIPILRLYSTGFPPNRRAFAIATFWICLRLARKRDTLKCINLKLASIIYIYCAVIFQLWSTKRWICCSKELQLHLSNFFHTQYKSMSVNLRKISSRFTKRTF